MFAKMAPKRARIQFGGVNLFWKNASIVLLSLFLTQMLFNERSSSLGGKFYECPIFSQADRLQSYFGCNASYALDSVL